MWYSGLGEKINSLRWFGHLERIKNEEFKVCVSEIEDEEGYL